jgi:pyridoxamine 5'-phosphate oxidase
MGEPTRGGNPFAQFREWFDQAPAETVDAVTLATVDESGMPWARVVLLKSFDARGFCFFTNLGSPKARQIKANPRATLCFHWPGRQVRIQGNVEQVPDAESDAYFATRPRESQIGAWASRQSEPLASREELEARFAEFAAQFGSGAVPRPPFWAGFRVAPERIEFWEERPYRLHDRVLYTRTESGWLAQRLWP